MGMIGKDDIVGVESEFLHNKYRDFILTKKVKEFLPVVIAHRKLSDNKILIILLIFV